jgi:hypothetical protein
MKHKKPAKAPAQTPPAPDFSHNPFAAALADKKKAGAAVAGKGSQSQGKSAQAQASQGKPSPAQAQPPSPPSPHQPPRSPLAPEKHLKLPDKPMSADELFTFALNQLPADLKPYDLKFGTGREAPRLPEVEDEAERRAKAAEAAMPRHLTPEQREAIREATRVREQRDAFEQEMYEAGVARVTPSKRIDLQTPTTPSVADLLAKSIEPARPSLSRGAHTSPDLLDQLHDPTDPSNALSIPPNFTFAQRRLLERAQRRDGSIPELSLRGLTLAEALPALQTFLIEQRAAGARTVRVITGKGKQSEGAPVLKGAVEGFLLSVAAHHITAFAPEITRDGDFGAFAVQLKR